ncbi:CheR family methyltransferase [Anaerovorax odorimutans]|uniref:CheR family methyltransferase n=1 Tax=Anaerovorax odorimutans TaxID=109327 RepID=UPI000415FD92|nr:protein-glutamate O-methyltransferase CheR [Anaerovorax odorimutans]
MLEITQTDFLRLVKFVEKNYGIDLSKKKHLIEGRLSNFITDKGFADFSSYVDHILKKNTADVQELLNRLTTNHTFFMRESTHFDFFKNTILPQFEQKNKNKVLSIWSAGCSSGEEPYTLSMILADYFGPKFSQWDTRILATDISQKVLSQAKEAAYSENSIANVPDSWKKNYFMKSGTKYTIVPKIKDNVIFRMFNLMDPIKFKMKFDIIFCRNVMIYFDQPTKDALINRFYHATNNGGYLLIGHSETLNRESTPYQYLMPATYKKL